MQTGHAIITGGSSGIGLELARQLTQRGWDLSLIARDPARLQEAHTKLVAEKQNSNQSIYTCQADVAEHRQIDDAIQQAIRVNGPPLLLITCAGTVKAGYFSQLSLDDFERINRVNYLGTVYTVKSVVPRMLKQQRGCIVMISSGAGLMGLYGYTAYSPTKFAVRGLAESLRPELKADGIRVSVVYPPDTLTPQLIKEQKSRPVETRYIAETGGTMSAEDVAAAILTGIDKGKFSITPGASMTWLNRLHSLAGPVLQKYFDHLADKAGK